MTYSEAKDKCDEILANWMKSDGEKAARAWEKLLKDLDELS